MRPYRLIILLMALMQIPDLGLAFPFLDNPASDNAKADYIIKLVDFMQWPEQDPQADRKKPIYIGVIGSSKLQLVLNGKLHGKTARGRQFEVKGFTSADLSDTAQFRDCNILYVAPSEKRDVPVLLKAIKGSSALSVSDMKDFNVMGGMIEMGGAGDNIVSTVYLEQINAAGIFIDPKFLNAAKTPQRRSYFGRPSGR
jgi:hypothetical protein